MHILHFVVHKDKGFMYSVHYYPSKLAQGYLGICFHTSEFLDLPEEDRVWLTGAVCMKHGASRGFISIQGEEAPYVPLEEFICGKVEF